MFHAYVQKLPMVDGNLKLTSGERLEFSCGSIRKTKADSQGFRGFVLTDRFRDISYRITKDGMIVSYPTKETFVPNPGWLEHTPFAVVGDDSEINAFLALCNEMVAEYKRKKSLMNRLRLFTKEPVGKAIIAIAVIYGIATIVVLFLG